MFRSQPGHRVLFLFLFIHLATNSLPDLKQPQQLTLSDEQCASLGLFFERKKEQIITKGHETKHCWRWRPYGCSNRGVSSALWGTEPVVKHSQEHLLLLSTLHLKRNKNGSNLPYNNSVTPQSVFTPRLPVLCSWHQAVTNPSHTSTGAGTLQILKSLKFQSRVLRVEETKRRNWFYSSPWYGI